MKKFISAVFILCLSFALSACGDSETVVEGVMEMDVEVSTSQQQEKPVEENETDAPEKEAEQPYEEPGPYEKAEILIKAAEEEELRLSENSSAFSQTEINDSAFKLYESWDGCLNAVWTIVSENVSEDVMKVLTAEETAWIRDKDAAVEEAGREVEGGSLYPAVTFTKAAELTKERVYILIEYLK